MEKKSKGKKLLRTAVILYIVILATVTVATLGWFVFDGNAGITAEAGVKITVGNNLEISRWTKDKGWSVYGQSIEITKKEMNFSCPDITGGIIDGELKFFYPKALDDNDNLINDASLLEELNGTEGYYLELRVKFRSASEMGIYLSGDSYVSPVDTSKKNSTYGSAVSTDYIAGAARVSFSEVTEVDANGKIVSETLKSIWIPNDHIELYYDEEFQEVNGNIISHIVARVNESGERELFYRDAEEGSPNYGSTLPYGYMGVLNGEIQQYAWTVADYYNKLVTVGNGALAVENKNSATTIGNACEIVNFDGADGKLNEKEVVIRIWFEGTDREADEAFNGGEVKYQFSFVGVNKDAPTEETVSKLESIKYNTNGTLSVGDTPATVSDNILYSYNGIDWSLYNNSGINTLPIDTSYTEIYVKISETVANKETAVRVLQRGN